MTPNEREKQVFRLLGSVVIVESCWEWVRYRNNFGYGVTFYQGTNRLAHRVSYMLHVGPIPPGLEIDHICNNRGCVNPAHLRLVTHRENVLRGNTIAARMASKNACKHGHAYSRENTRLTKEGIRQCRTCDRNLKRIKSTKEAGR